MRSLLLASSLLLLAACSGSSSVSPTDASAADAPGDAQRTDEANAGDAHASDAGVLTCQKPLTDNVDLDTAPLAEWCAEGNGGGSRSKNTCEGYYVITIGEGADCDTQYFFDATTKKLVAKIHGCNNITTLGSCVEGPASFTPPSAACFDDKGFAYDYDVCPEDGGTGDAASDLTWCAPAHLESGSLTGAAVVSPSAL